MRCGSCPVCGAKNRLFRSFASGTRQFDLHGKRWYQFAPEIVQCRTCRTRLVPMRETVPWARTLGVSAIALYVAGKLVPAFFLDSSTDLRTISMVTTLIACSVLAILICNRRYTSLTMRDDAQRGSDVARR